MHLGIMELVVILVIVLLIIGPKQLPRLTKTVAESISTFKKARKSDEEEVSSEEPTKEEATVVNE